MVEHPHEGLTTLFVCIGGYVSSLTSANILPTWKLQLVEEKFNFVCKKSFEYSDINVFSTIQYVFNLFIWGFTSLSTLYRSYHDG